MLSSIFWAVLVVMTFFDITWLLRLVLTKLISRVKGRLGVKEEGVVYNICWTTDIDYFFHMNNGKYFRDMDFGRFDFYFRSGFSQYIESRPKMFFVQHGASIRYRKSIDFLVPFKLVTKLVYWDERSLYFEQRFVSLHDNFVRAIALCKNTCVGGTVVDMLDSVGVTTQPQCPEEVELWIQSQEVSSTRLRIEGAGKSSVNLSDMDKEKLQEDRMSLNHCFGGDYDKYGDYIVSFFHLLKSCGVTPTVVFDGGYDKTEVKLRTVMTRLREQAKNAVACTSATQGKIQVYPLMAKEMFIDLVKQLGVKVVQCSYEADDVIAHLAASLHCPVLSNDSDFFIFNVDFISLDSLQLDVHCDPDASFLSCEIFDRTKFLSYYGLRTIDLLHLLASLIGNDYISTQSFERIFESMKMPPKRRDTSDRHRRIKGTITWLAKHKSADTALTKLLGCFPEKERAKLKEKVAASMLVYSCQDVGKEVAIISPDFSTFEGIPFPDWFVDSFHQAILPSWFLDISGRRKLFLISQVESKEEVTSHHVAFHIHEKICELLTSLDENTNQGVQIFARKGASFHVSSMVQPESQEIVSSNLSDLTLHNINLLSKSERKSYLFSVLCPALEQEGVDQVADNLQFIAMIMHYWSLNDVVTKAQVVAILASFFVLNFIDSVVGRVRTTKKIEQLLTASKQESQEVDDGLSKEKCTKAIKSVVKYFYMDEKLKSSAKNFNLDLVHSFAKFQACFFAAASLNKLLGQVFKTPLFSQFYNGTFVYNVATHLNKVQESNLDKHQWASEEVTERFNQMAQSVLKLLPDLNEKTSPKKKKKKGSKASVILKNEKDITEDEDETSENEFYDVQNKFAALSV